jgi:hypothetical protein
MFFFISHPLKYFKTTVLPDGRAITSFHVAGVDGEPGRRGSFTDDPALGTGSSTQRLDFSERVYNHPEDRGNTTRFVAILSSHVKLRKCG